MKSENVLPVELTTKEAYSSCLRELGLASNIESLLSCGTDGSHRLLPGKSPHSHGTVDPRFLSAGFEVTGSIPLLN